jgi:hypothetical protein
MPIHLDLMLLHGCIEVLPFWTRMPRKRCAVISVSSGAWLSFPVTSDVSLGDSVKRHLVDFSVTIPLM